MARITVEDCIDKVSNRFDLVILAGQRARQISSGSDLTVPRDNDKNPIVSLREIAEETVDPKLVRESLISQLQHFSADEEDAPDQVDSLDDSENPVDLDITT